MKKNISAKQLISKIRYNRLIIVLVIIVAAWTLINWMINFLTGTTSSQTVEVNKSESNISTDSQSDAIDAIEPTYISANDGHIIADFEAIYQLPELPTGCEITALTMILQFYGCDVTKTEMAEYYLPTAEYDFYYDENDTKIGPDVNCFFIGNPAKESGFICGSKAIESAANNYFYDADKAYEAAEFIGLSANELYDYVSENTPVFVLVTIGMEDRAETEGWYTEEGEYVEWSTNDHGAVLIGYSSDTVTIADPLAGIVQYEREQFEKVYDERDQKCVIIKSTGV